MKKNQIQIQNSQGLNPECKIKSSFINQLYIELGFSPGFSSPTVHRTQWTIILNKASQVGQIGTYPFMFHANIF